MTLDSNLLTQLSRRRSANRRNGAYAPYQANPEYAYRYRRAVSDERGEGEISKEETIIRGKTESGF